MSAKTKVAFGVVAALGSLIAFMLCCVAYGYLLEFLQFAQRNTLLSRDYIGIAIVIGGGLLSLCAMIIDAWVAFLLFRSAATGCSLPHWLVGNTHVAH